MMKGGMKIKICPNCKIDLICIKKGRIVKVYRCPECGFERTVEGE
jgi:predicted RNA-binding Zn-ribbon protein involved in translation (DUF1610 family)